jgi:hypothetical protein
MFEHGVGERERHNKELSEKEFVLAAEWAEESNVMKGCVGNVGGTIGHGLFERSILALVWKNLQKLRKSSVRIAWIPTEIQNSASPEYEVRPVVTTLKVRR